MLTNADITLFNRRYNPVTRVDDWQRTYIKGVSWMAAQDTTSGPSGIIRENVVRVRIPQVADAGDRVYMPKELYIGAGDSWTIQQGDYIVKGLVDFEAPTKENLKVTPDTYSIVGFADNRRGGLPHWRITGK